MEIKLFNSLTNQLEVFKPLRDKEVSIYCCGPTVYGDAHVGNIRPVIVFDTLRRFLSFVGYDVKLVSNFTDVDDKIIKKALEEGVAEQVITDRYIAAYKNVLKELNVDYVVWFAHVKQQDGFGFFKMPRVVIYEVKKIKKYKFKDYSKYSIKNVY